MKKLAQNMPRRKSVWHKILCVGLTPSLFKALKNYLENQNFLIERENNLDHAFKTVMEQEVTIVLFAQDTYKQTGNDFISKCSRVMTQPAMIVITTNTHTDNFRFLFQYKIYDCLIEPFQPPLLVDSIQRGALYQNAHIYGVKDPLTGMYNRYAFKEMLAVEIDRAHRYERHLSLLMIDIDHFKRVNDRFGHVVGDRVLEEIAKVIKQAVRKTDVITRFGGEEFAIILPETTVGHATMLAERIRKKIESHDYSHLIKKESITVSIGISNYHTPGQKSDISLVHSADKALYAAKKEGRNKVVISVG